MSKLWSQDSRLMALVHNHLVTSQSRRLTQLLAARVDSPEPRVTLSWSEPTSEQVPTEPTTSPSDHSTGPLLPRVQLTEKTRPHAAKRCRAEVSDSVSPIAGEPAVAQLQALPRNL